MDLKRLNQLAQITSPPLDYKIVIDKDTDAQSYCMSLSDLKALMIAGVSTNIIRDAASTTYVSTASSLSLKTIVMRSDHTSKLLELYNNNSEKVMSYNTSGPKGLLLPNAPIIARGLYGIATNTAVGEATLRSATAGYNTAVGTEALMSIVTGTNNTAVGYNAGYFLTLDDNVAIGKDALFNGTYSSRNVAVGVEALRSQFASECVAVGHRALTNNYYASNNTAIGNSALLNNHADYGSSGASHNTAIGHYAMFFNISGSWNVSVGKGAMGNSNSTNACVAVGMYSGRSSGDNCTSLGFKANYNTNNYINVSCLGANSTPTASNQVILGDGAITDIYAGSSHLHSVSDERDKADIEDNQLGLLFLEKIKTIKYKVNNRNLYKKEEVIKIKNPNFVKGGHPKLIKNPNFVNPKEVDSVNYIERLKHPLSDLEFIENPNYNRPNEEFIETGIVKSLPNDGTKKGKRPHVGVSAQQVKKVMDELGIDFAGYQDHGLKGEHLSIAYTQFIGPLIKSVQELSAKIKILENK